MKISLIQSNLLEALQRVVYITNKNTTLPILKNILLRVSGNTITFISTNLELSVTSTLRGKIHEEGEITIPGRLFLEYIQLLPEDQVDIETEGQKILITCKNFHTTILGMSAEDFPLLPESPKGEEILFQSKLFREAAGSVLHAVAPDERRPEISGVFFRIEKGKMTFVATDSYRLAEKIISITQSPKEKKEVILPATSVHELARILGDGAGEVKMIIGENQVVVTTDVCTFSTRIIDGKYPDYEQVIPPNHKTRATIAVQEFAKAVKGASLFAPSGVNDIHLHFYPSKREVEITAASGHVGENRIVVSGEVLGEENSIVFNWRYLMEGVDRVKTHDVVIDIVNPTNPGVLRPKDDTGYTYLIMPIKQ